MNDVNEKQDEMETVLSHVVDPALKTVLEAGIGYFFKVSENGNITDCCVFYDEESFHE